MSSNEIRLEPDAWEQAKPRTISAAQWKKYESYIAEILEALGLPLRTDGTVDTPQRYLTALFDLTQGYDGDPKLLRAFDIEGSDPLDATMSQVIEGPIDLFSLCEHHVLPFFGQAYVGYIAAERIIGISKLTRLVRLFANRFTVQERLTQEVADTLTGMLAPQGAAVYVEATHLCTAMRGVRESNSRTRTVVWRGRYAQDPDLREEFLRICRAPV